MRSRFGCLPENGVYRIDPNKEIENIVCFIKDYFLANGPEAKAVIGISGGKDSTVAAALLCRALGHNRVIGVLMPDGEQADIADSYKVCQYLGIKYEEINIGDITDAFYMAVGCGDCENPVIQTNTPPRIRLNVLYAIAAIYGGRVCNTSNWSESEIGWCTKWGDMAGDFALLTDYTVGEILAIGDALGLPKDLVHKKPHDGMCGLTDEDKFGFTYEVLEDYLQNNKYPDLETMAKIDDMRKKAHHKHNTVYIPHPHADRFVINEDTGEIIERGCFEF